MGVQMVSFIATIFLVFPLTAISESNIDPQYLPLDNLINLEEMMHKETAELVWANCGTELMHLIESFQDLQSSSNFDRTLLEHERILKSLAFQDLQIKKTILDCLRDKSVGFLESGEDKHPRKWFMEFLEYFSEYFSSGISNARRIRRLAEADSPVSSPSPSPSPSPAEAPSIRKPPSPPFFPKLNDSSSGKDAAESPLDSGSKSQSSSGNNGSHRKIIIAVVVTATVTFFLAAVLFCCYTRICGNRRGQNDDRPLLSLSLSDYSMNGAPYKTSYNLSNSVHNIGNIGDESLYSNSNLQKMDSSFDPRVSFDSNIPLGIPLRPPPGRVEVESSLRPPPGRVESSLRPPPGRVEVESSLRPPPGRVESSLRPPPGRVESSKRPSEIGAPSPPSTTAPPPPPPVSPRPPTAGPPPPPPPPRGAPPPPPPKPNAGPRPPPPPPRGGAPPPRPPSASLKPPRPSAGPSHSSTDDSDASKAKLKPFFWDKVMANPDQSMVWHQIKSGSFQFSEEMIETLFGYNATDKNKDHTRKNSASQDPGFQYIQIIDPKKAQNLSILLKALNVTTEEICDALKEGNELPVELVQTLIKMAPTADEELKLRMYNGNLSQLGTAERFLKLVIEIPFAFKRLESLLFMCTFQEEESMIKESFVTLEAACVELRKSRLFLKLLEAVLKTGNRMNDGTFRGSAQAFKLDTLLKLSDVKGIDGKTTLLHFVVQEIIRSEGIKAVRVTRESKSFRTDDLLKEASSSSQETEERYRVLGLQVVSGLSSELENVKKAAIVDADGLTSLVSRLGHALVKSREFLDTDLKKIDEDGDEFQRVLSNFVKTAGKEITWMLEEEKRIMALIKNTADYFHGKSGKDEGLRLFVIVRDFLIILDKVCKEVSNYPVSTPRTQKNDELQGGVQRKDDQAVGGGPSEPRKTPFFDQHQRLFPAIAQRRMESSSSDED
ncbi:formin-like protein 5 [Cynara cardunculus var. scolymus]|uniref:formin-like protein 5 n=1 Tax=Cynara cardunculus var. scolymus TaxID=59895 RepID=UPI000D6266D3|nr:formin-like protein 5 [Cynara cardunculus var. scolymus]